MRRKLNIISEDALNFDIRKLNHNPFKIISNLPYNISTKVILYFLYLKMSKNDMNKIKDKLYNESIKRKENDEICKMKIFNQTILRAEENTKLSEKISGKLIPYEIVERREGDPDKIYASSDYAKNILNWSAEESDLENIIETTCFQNTLCLKE